MSAQARTKVPATEATPGAESAGPEAGPGRGSVGNAELCRRLASMTPQHEDIRPAMDELDRVLPEDPGWKSLHSTLERHFQQEESGDTAGAYADHPRILQMATAVAGASPAAADFVAGLERHAAAEDRQGG